MGGPSVKGLKFRIQVTPRNCVGCSLCAVECPGKKVKDENGNLVTKKALEMVEAKSQYEVQEPAADYLYKHVEYKSNVAPVTTVKGLRY